MSQIDLILKELKFEIDIGENIDFDTLVLNFSDLTNNFLIPELQEIINSCFDENEDIVFNRIVINIGEISLKKKNLTSKNIANKLGKEFHNLSQVNNLNFRTNEILIVHFLRFGFLPWWAGNNIKFNEFLSRNSYQENSKRSIYSVVTKNKFYFFRFFNALNSKNKTIFFKEYLQKNYSFFSHSTIFLEVLLETIKGGIESNDKALISYELFNSLIRYKNETEVAFSLVLKKIIEDFNIEWKIVKEVFLLKSKEKKTFLNLLQFDEDLFFSNELPSKSSLSNLALIRQYIEYGVINELKNFGLPNLFTAFSNALKNDKKALNVLFDQLNVYKEPIKIFRISKLLNLNNLHDYFTLTFESSYSFLLRHSFSFLKFMELKGDLKNPSLFYFINAIIKLKTLSRAKKKVFYKKLIDLLSETYSLDNNVLLVEFYFFSASQAYQTPFQDVIELFHFNKTSEDYNNSVLPLINQLKTNNNFSYSTLLSSNQKIYYKLLMEQIIYLNQSVVLNSWTKIYTEAFIFNLLIEQNSFNRTSLLNTLKIYANANSFDIHRLVIAVLMKFYPTAILIEKGSADILEYVLLVIQTEVYQKFSKKEQLFIQIIQENKTLKSKFEVALLKYNSELDYQTQHSDINEFKIQGKSFNQNLNYLFEEINSIIDSHTLLKINKNQLLQILIIEFKKYSIKNNQINYQLIIKNIADITNTDSKKLTMSLLKKVGSKTSYSSKDVILLDQMSESFFNFSNLKQASRKSINNVIKLVQKISDQNIKQKIFKEYIINSSVVILKLKDKNYKSLINSLTSHKRNHFFIILTNILSVLPYKKRIELSLKLKQKALLFSQEKNLSDEQFYTKLLNEINLIDAVLFKKIKAHLSLNIDSLFAIINPEKSNDKIDEKDSKKSIQEVDEEAAIKKQTNFEIKNYKPINSLNKRDFDYFLNLKNELNLEVEPELFKSGSFKNLDDILATDTKFIDFLTLYIDDFELLIEFARASFNEPIRSRLEALLKSHQPEIGRLEKQLIQLHKASLFTTLNRLELKIILRVYILKSFAYYKQNTRFNASEFTLNFIENLSNNGKINFKQTSSIVNYIDAQTTIEKEIKEGVVSFFDRNNFEFIQKKVKEVEFFKNNIHFSILNKEKLDLYQDQKLTVLETTGFIKARIKNNDKRYIQEFLLEEKTAYFFASAFKNLDTELHFEVFKLLELSHNNSFSIKKVYEQIIKLKKSSDKQTSFIFEHIIKEVLWNQPSILYLFDIIYTKLKKKKKFTEFKFILDLEIHYPSIKLIVQAPKIIDKVDKIELIRYYIQSGKLPETLKSKKDIHLQSLKAFANKDQLRFLLIEFAETKMVSKHFIKISSKAIFVDLILEELESIDTDFKYVFDLVLQSNTFLSIQNEYVFYDLLLNYIIAPRSIHKSNLKVFLTTIKSMMPNTYQIIVKIIYKLVANSPNLNTNIALIAFLNLETFSIKSSKIKTDNFKMGSSSLSDTFILKQNSPLSIYILSESASYDTVDARSKDYISLKSEQVEFNTFINQIRYFVEFKSFDRASEISNPAKLFVTVLKFKSKLILKKQIHNWSKYSNKISVLMKLFPEKEITELIKFIHPKQLDSIKIFNEVLKVLNYKTLQEYLKLNSIQKFTSKVLNVWSKHSIIINTPNIVLHSLFEELLLNSDIDAKEIVHQLEMVLTELNPEQTNLVKAILIQSNISKIEKKSLEPLVLEENLQPLESGSSMYINNAGLILIWPFLSTLFNKLGLLNGKSFMDDTSLQKAILVTQYVIFEGNENEESNLVLNKILCGVAPDFFVDTNIELNETEKSIAKSVLKAVTGNWEQLNKTSIFTLKETFLKREGIIQKVDDNYKLIVEKKPFDMLLRTIPWNILMIQNSFMSFRLIVEWEN